MKLSVFGLLAVLIVAAWWWLAGDPEIVPVDRGTVRQEVPEAEGSAATAPDSASDERQAVVTDEEKAGDVEVASPALVGRIIDAAARPVAEARLIAWPPGNSDRRDRVVIESGVDGTFRMGLPAGEWNLVAFAAAHGKVVREGYLVANEDVDVGDLVLQPMPALLGRLVYADGQPIKQFEVRVGPVGGNGLSPANVRHAQVLTDDDGRIAIRTLDDGEYELIFNCWGFRGEEEPTLRLKVGETMRDLVIDWHRIRARDTYDVGLCGWREDRASELQAAERTGNGWRELWDSANVSVAGNVSDSLVARGTWWYLSNSEDGKWAEVLVHADRARNETVIDLAMRPIELSGTLRVRLRAIDGTVPDAVKMRRVEATSLQSPKFYEPAPRDGDDFMFRMAPGRYAIQMRVGPDKGGFDAFAMLNREVHIRANQETLLEDVARTGGRVQMTVHFPSGEKGKHLSRFKATTLDESGQEVAVRPYQTQTADGYMRGGMKSDTPFTCMKILRPGRHEFTVTVKGFDPVRVSAFLEAGKTTSVEVHLR